MYLAPRPTDSGVKEDRHTIRALQAARNDHLTDFYAEAGRAMPDLGTAQHSRGDGVGELAGGRDDYVKGGFYGALAVGKAGVGV